MTGATLALLWNIAYGAFEIGGSATCPSPAEVEVEVERRGGMPASSDQHAVLEEEGGEATPTPARPRLRLRLFDAAGTLLGERTLVADAPCQSLAATLATMLLSFELDLGEAPPTSVPESIPIPIAPAPHKVHRFAFEGGIGGFFSLTSDGGDAASGLALLSLGVDGSPFQPELLGQIESARQLNIRTGLAHWERLWVAPGLQYRIVRRPRFWASLHLDLPVGAAFATGSNLSVNRSGSFAEVGIGAGLRVGLGLASLFHKADTRAGLVPWAGLWVIYWPVTPELLLSNASSQVRLPFLEALAGVGLSWSGM